MRSVEQNVAHTITEQDARQVRELNNSSLKIKTRKKAEKITENKKEIKSLWWGSFWKEDTVRVTCLQDKGRI